MTLSHVRTVLIALALLPVGYAGAAEEEVALDPVASTPDAGKAAGEHADVRVGRNANCVLRGDSTDAYVKENAEKYPGAWGWMNMCRAGGPAGEGNTALLHFDLSGIPKTASVKQARLVLFLTPFTNRDAKKHRIGAYLVKLPESPGWAGGEVTASERAEGKPWPKGGVRAAVAEKPVALGKVVGGEYTDRRGRKRKINAEVHFDLTGAVRAWVQGKASNCGVALDGRPGEGGVDFYSSRSFHPEKRPYLEIALSPAPKARPKPLKVKAALPPGDYWVGPMRKVHARFDGKPGTLAQYGDSITISQAFLGYRFGKNAPPSIAPPRDELALKDTPPAVKKELEVIEKHSDRELWWRWKGGKWGNTGMMKSDWLFKNIDGWQKKMDPEASVIMFGTNDRGRICPPVYTEYMAASVKRMLADGTVPMVTTIPPPAHESYRLAILSIAHGLKVPVIDYNAEMYRRRGDDWSGKKKPPGLISRDGTHPSHPKEYQFSFSEEALNHNGYLLRDYLTLRMYYQVITKVLRADEK